MKFKPLNASAAIIIDKKNNFLLQKRDLKPNIFFPGHWGLFGGAKEKNERYVTGLKREIDEEIGLIPKNIEYFINLKFDLKNIKNKEIHRRFYICKVNDLSKIKIQLKEGEKYGIFKIEELKKKFSQPNIFVPYDHFALWLYINKKNLT